MGYFERRYVRPSHFQVVDSLEQAVNEASGTEEVAEPNSDYWDNFVTDIREQPEGCHQWHRGRKKSNVGLVGIAWWTDFLGRRHFRIWAGSSADNSSPFRPNPDPEQQPPLWHIAPENVFSRTSTGRREWLAACSCGLVGKPQAIGWVGTCCGVCHYSKSEAPAETQVRLRAFTEAGVPLQSLAFSPDGRWLAGAPALSDVHLWDVLVGEHKRIPFDHAETQALAFTPDGRMLARAGGDRLLRFVEIATGREIAAYPVPKAVRSVTIAPDNLTLAIVAEGTLEVWGRPEASLPWLPTHVRQGSVRAVAFDGRGDRLAAAIGWDVVVLRIAERAGFPFPYRSCWPGSMLEAVRLNADGRLLVGIQHHSRHSGGKIHAQQEIVSWDVERNRLAGCHSLHFQSAGHAFSLDAEWLAGIDGPGVVIEHVRDESTWCRLESGRRRKLTALAFAPDGQTLATADEEGRVKLWPWHRLVEV